MSEQPEPKALHIYIEDNIARMDVEGEWSYFEVLMILHEQSLLVQERWMQSSVQKSLEHAQELADMLGTLLKGEEDESKP